MLLSSSDMINFVIKLLLNSIFIYKLKLKMGHHQVSSVTTIYMKNLLCLIKKWSKY